MEPAVINGELGILATLGGHNIGALSFDLVDGLIQNLRFQVNPDKLGGLTQENLLAEPGSAVEPARPDDPDQ